MKRLLFLMVSVLFLLTACGGNKSEEKAEADEERGEATNKMKLFRVGQTVSADGVDIKVMRAEYVENYDEYSAPENDKVLKVYLKFKNNNKDQVLVDNSAFSMKVRGENYPEWYGGDGTEGMFSHQLNQGNTATGTLVYDVPESNFYTLEMDANFNLKNVKAKWNISKAMIKKGNGSSDETEVSTTSSSKNDDSESKDYPYTADEYNALVDEYNALTDGEKMNHVTRGVTNKEYNDLAARVDKLYEQLGAEYEKEYQKQLEKEEAEWQKEQDRLDKEFDAEMKRQDEAYAREEAQRQKQEAADQRAYEAEQKRIEEQEAREAAAAQKQEEEWARQEAELQKQEAAMSEE